MRVVASVFKAHNFHAITGFAVVGWLDFTDAFLVDSGLCGGPEMFIVV